MQIFIPDKYSDEWEGICQQIEADEKGWGINGEEFMVKKLEEMFEMEEEFTVRLE